MNYKKVTKLEVLEQKTENVIEKPRKQSNSESLSHEVNKALRTRTIFSEKRLLNCSVISLVL